MKISNISSETPGITPIEIILSYLFISIGSITCIALKNYLFVKFFTYQKTELIILISIGVVILPIIPFKMLENSYCYFHIPNFFVMGIGLSVLISSAYELVLEFTNNNYSSLKSARIFSIFSLGDKLLSGISLFILVNNIVLDETLLSWFFPLIAPILSILSMFLYFVLKKGTEEVNNIYDEHLSVISKFKLNTIH